MIDRSGEWWKGSTFDDLAEFLKEFSAATGDPSERTIQSRCGCGHEAFGLVVDDEAGCARRTCNACGSAEYLLDSEEHWEDADPGEAACPCGGEQFEVGVGFALRDDGDVRWVYVSGRCVECGILGVYADWKIDYSPTSQLFSAV